jgi:hypothetical protein
MNPDADQCRCSLACTNIIENMNGTIRLMQGWPRAGRRRHDRSGKRLQTAESVEAIAAPGGFAEGHSIQDVALERQPKAA